MKTQSNTLSGTDGTKTQLILVFLLVSSVISWTKTELLLVFYLSAQS